MNIGAVALVNWIFGFSHSLGTELQDCHHLCWQLREWKFHQPFMRLYEGFCVTPAFLSTSVGNRFSINSNLRCKRTIVALDNKAFRKKASAAALKTHTSILFVSVGTGN
jgi:hypothetical protein